MRINKYIAHAGVASRRKAEELIKQGLVTVNGQVVRELGTVIKSGDKVEVEENQFITKRRSTISSINHEVLFLVCQTTREERQLWTCCQQLRSGFIQLDVWTGIHLGS